MYSGSVIVTGSSGFIGGFVVEALKRSGLYVVGVDRIPPAGGYGDSAVPDVFIKGDVTNLDFVKNVISEYSPDAVINLVGIPHVPTCEQNPHLSYVVNVYTAHNVLEAVRSFGVKRYVFASSAAVYGETVAAAVDENFETSPTSIYGWHKLEAEIEAKGYSERYGIEAVILRLFNVYGADPARGKDVASIFLRKLLRGEKIVVYGPNKIRDFIYIEDVARAFVEAANRPINKPFCVINVGTGKPTRIIELLKLLESVVGRKAEYVVYNEDDRGGYYADIRRLREVLGVNPRPLEKGLRDWLRRIGVISA